MAREVDRGEGSVMERMRRRRRLETHKEGEIRKYLKPPLEAESLERIRKQLMSAAGMRVEAKEYLKDGKKYWYCPLCKSVCALLLISLLLFICIFSFLLPSFIFGCICLSMLLSLLLYLSFLCIWLWII